jgi:drug/metabolite transporter (DMT)-like permease
VYDRVNGLNVLKTLHLILSSLLFYLLSLLTIYAASFAIKAGINFGVIASCISLSTPFNCLFSYLFYGEKLTPKMIIGTGVLFSGVVVVSLSKASNDPN